MDLGWGWVNTYSLVVLVVVELAVLVGQVCVPSIRYIKRCVNYALTRPERFGFLNDLRIFCDSGLIIPESLSFFLFFFGYFGDFLGSSHCAVDERIHIGGAVYSAAREVARCWL